MISNELEIFKQSILDDVRVMMQTTGQVTQYIGSRYVPLFAEPFEWDINKEYEPLTIVTNQGNSFTSRQFVPKGVDISDTSFWASTGNYNAQIEQYRQEVAAFDARITAAQNAADSKAPVNHATDSTEYGVGSAVNYGHVKLADTNTSMTSGANDGIAATPKNIYDYSGITKVSNFSELKAAINSSSYNKIILITGTIECSETLNLKNGTFITGFGPTISKLVFPADVNGISAKSSPYAKDIVIKNLGIECAEQDWHEASHKGIDITASSYIIDNVSVRWFGTGLLLNAIPKANYVESTHNGECRIVNNFNVYGCADGITNNLQDALFSNIVIGSCTNSGFYNDSGNSAINNIHIWAIQLYGILNGGSLSVNNVEIESNPNSSSNSSAWIRQWGGRSVINNLRIWNIQKPIGNIVYNSAGEMTISNAMIYGCATENVAKQIPPLALINANSSVKTLLKMDVALDDSYDSIAGNGYTNTGNANVLILTATAPANSKYTQPFVTKTGGSYYIKPTSL